MKESDIQRQILDYLEARGIVHWKVHLGGVRIRGSGARFAKNKMAGFPDIGFVVDGGLGRMGAIEVKKPKTGRMQENQKIWRDKLESKGVVYIVATSVEDVAKRLIQEWF